MTRLVFDTAALSHFARAGRTDTLRILVADDEPNLLAEVATELVRGVSGYPSLGSAAAGDWLEQVELEELQEIAAFARYKGELGGGLERNNGEAAVLAWVSVNGGVAIIDEAAARHPAVVPTLQMSRSRRDVSQTVMIGRWPLNIQHRHSPRSRTPAQGSGCWRLLLMARELHMNDELMSQPETGREQSTLPQYGQIFGQSPMIQRPSGALRHRSVLMASRAAASWCSWCRTCVTTKEI